MAIGLAMLSRIRPDGPFTTSVLIPSLIIAVGVGLATVPLYATSTAGITGRTAGIASGLLTAAQSVGSSLGLAVLVTIATSRTTGVLASLGGSASPTQLRVAHVDGFAVGLLAAAAFAVAGMIIAMITLGRRPGRQRT
jgi:hypothetical protein